MAINRHHKSILDYNRYYVRWTALMLIFPVFSAASFAIIAHLIFLRLKLPLDAWYIAIIMGVIGGALGGLAILPLITRPMRNVLYAASYKTGERTAEPPAKVNAPDHQRTGFTAVLEAVYAGTDAAQPATPVAESPADLALQALNHNSCGIVILDAQRNVLFANNAAPVATGTDGQRYLALEFIGEPSIYDWLNDIADDNITATKQWTRIPAAHAKNTTPQAFYDIDVSYQKGAVGETVVVLFDRSATYAPEEEDLNFISFAAHELRGPVTVIRGYLDILQQELAGQLRGDQPQLFNRLTVSANRLTSYINNILNVAKFDRHHLRVHLREDSVAAIYASIADDMQLRASSQHRILNVIIPDDLPTVAADRGSISEVISNLIDNAIKYSFEGGIIQVTAVQKGEFIEISVADNGVGMPAAVIKNLFRKFYRSHRSRETVAGTGIGLYICKAFVESHGGHISVRSQENEGSIFSFTIPTYAAVKDKLLESGELNSRLIRTGGGWIKNHQMYRE